MFCVRCKTHFSWSEAQDRTTDTKVLLENYENDVDNIQQAFEQENMGDDSNATKPTIITKFLLQRTKKCPNETCGKIQIKSGTGNYMICESCKRGFCFSCGK